METMSMYKNFDFNSFMKRRGWNSLAFMLIGLILTLLILNKALI
jgi:hypothetical protein